MTTNVSSCESQLSYIMESLKDHQIWSMEFLDLSAKLPIGILHQYRRRFGLFSECLNFRHDTEEVGLIEGQYCTVSYESSLNNTNINKTHGFDWKDLGYAASRYNLKLQNGICAPAICTESSIQSFVSSILSQADLVATNVSCLKNKEDDLGIYGSFCTCLLALLVIIIGISTFLDIKWRKNYDSRKNLLTSFSIYTNTAELLKIDKTNTKNSIECLNGMRWISAYWVIAGHQVAKGLGFRLLSMPRPLNQNFFFRVLLHACYAVDTFFIISSILVTISCLRAFESGKFNFFKFYFNRYMRYAPHMVVILLFFLSYIPFILFDGPMRDLTGSQIAKCQNHWLSALFHLQTYYNLNEMCVGVWWYIHADFHLFLISPFIVYVPSKYGYKSFLGLSIAALAIQFYAFYVRTYDLVSIDDYYRLTHFRLGQWLVGIMFGYVIYQIEKRDEKLQLSKTAQYLTWMILIYAFVYIKYNLGWSPTYEASHDFMFSIIVGWMITSFHCFGSGGIINWFLSHPIWQPLAKLSLSIFCVHEIYIEMQISNTKEIAFYEVGWMCNVIAGDILASTFFGYILYVCIEAPVTTIVKFLMTNKKTLEMNSVPKSEEKVPFLCE